MLVAQIGTVILVSLYAYVYSFHCPFGALYAFIYRALEWYCIANLAIHVHWDRQHPASHSQQALLAPMRPQYHTSSPYPSDNTRTAALQANK